MANINQVAPPFNSLFEMQLDFSQYADWLKWRAFQFSI